MRRPAAVSAVLLLVTALSLRAQETRPNRGVPPSRVRQDTLRAPHFAAWAAKGTDLERWAARAEGAGLRLGAVRGGSRQQPDGQLISWVSTDPHTLLGDGLVPFLIDWGRSLHPARHAAGGVELVGLRAEHPTPEQIAMMLRQLDIELPVTAGSSPALVATLETPHGRVELR